jgi:elongation factor G
MVNDKIRNIVILGHLQSGKTTLVESLYSITTGAPKGSVEKGTTISDYTAEEKAKMASIKSAIVPIIYKDYKMNLIDVPGSDDFIGEAISAIKVVKGAVIVIDASSGIEVQTVKHWNMLKKKNIPTIIYVNKMDKEDIHFDNLMDSIRAKFGKTCIPFCYPMGHKDEFDGFVNCVTLKARKYNGKECEDAEIYDEKKAKTFELHNTMIEAVAQTSEDLLDKFFAGEQLTAEEIQSGLRKGVLDGELTPVLVGSATKNIGLHTMLDMFIDYLPNPSDLAPIVGKDSNGKEIERKTNNDEPFSAFIFKTIVDPYSGVSSIFKIYSGIIKQGQDICIPELGKTISVSQLYTVTGGKMTSVQELHAGDIGCITKVDGLETSMTICDPKNIIIYPAIEFPTAVYFKALVPKTKQDEDKLSQVLSKIMIEEKSVEIVRNIETNQQLIGTLSLGHLNYILDHMKLNYKLEVNLENVEVVYRETIKGSAVGDGRYVKQSGGSGFYGVVQMRFEPTEENHFSEEVFGGAVPKNYFPAVEKGFFEACEKGLLAGYPVIGVHAVLVDGKYHPVDSNELAFKMAAILAFKDAYLKCKPVILEPIYMIVVTVPQDFTGNILSDLNQRRAKIVGMDVSSNGNQKISALVPENEIMEYVNDLKSITQGAGYFNRKFYSYEEAPFDVQEKLKKAYANK